MLESQLCQSLNEKTVVEKELREQLEMLAIEKEKTLELLRSTQYEQNKLLEDHTNLEQEKQKIEENAKKLRMENNNLTLNIQELEIEKCKIETDCQDKAEKMSCLWKELENLQALLSSAQKSENCLNSEYQEHLQECQKEKLIYCEKISTFESQVNNLTVEKYEIQKRFQKNIDELYQEVETKKQELKTMQVDFQVKVQQMQCVEAELNTRIDSLSQRNEESENVITEKHKEITQLKEEKEGYSQEKLKLEMQLQKGYEKLKSEEEKRMKLESEKNEFLNQLKQLDDKISKLESNADCLIKEKAELYQASERNLCIMNKLKNELRKAEERNFSLTECKASLERKHEAQLKINISEKEQFTKRVSQAENQCIALKEEIIGKEKVWKEEMENLQKHFVSQVNKLHSDIAEYTEFNQQLKNKLNDVRKENEEEKRNLLNKLTQSETKVESVKKEKEETVNALFNKTKSLENENQLLIEKINETERNFQNMQESKKTLESEYYMCVEQKEHDKELLSKNISELLEQKKKMEDQYQSQIIQSRKEIQVLVSEKEEEHSSFQLEKQILKNQIDEFLSINGTLEVKADQLEKELQQSHAQLKEIKQELEYTKVIHSEEVEKYDSAQKFFQGKIGVLENDLNQKNENIGKYVEEIKEKEAYICDIRRIIKDLQAVIKETKNIASSKKDKKNISFALMSVVEEITTNNAKQLQTDEEKKLNGSKIQIEETSEHIENHQLEMEKRATSVSERLNWSNSQVPELENHREKIQKEFIWQETNNSKEEAQIKEDRKLIASCDELIASEESFANVDKENEMLENLVILVKSVNQELEGKLISVELTKDTLSSKIDELEPQVKELLKCKNTFESLVETLDKEKSELENAYQQQKLFIEALEKEKKILETKVSEISNAYEQSTTSFEIIQAKKIELENIKERLEHDLLNLKQEKEEIQDNLNNLSEDNAVLNSKFTDVKHEKERIADNKLEFRNQQLVKDKEALETIAKQFENEKKELKTKTQNCESLVKNFEMENKSLSEKVILLEEQQAKLSCQLKNTQEEKEETEKKYKDLKIFIFIRYSEQIDVYKAYTSEKKNQVNELQKSLENQKQALLQEKRTVAAFQSDLKDAHEKISTLEENIEQHKAILNHEKEQNKLLEVQLQYASSEIRKLQKERNSSNESLSQMQNKVNLASSQSQPSVGNTVQHLASSAYSVTMMLPHEAMDNIFNVEEKRPLKSASTQTVSQVPSITISRFNPTVSYAEDNLSGCFNNLESVHCSFNMTSNSLNPLNSLSLLARTGNEFPCEDEEGQFMDNTNLIDLKAGRCKVDGGNWRRLTELQRRNTLCLPHLKTSYPVETQMHDIRNFPDDALKAGPVIEEPFILRERTNKLMSDRRMTLAISNLTADKVHTSPTGNKRKRTDSTESESSIGSFKGRGAPLQPTYSKPGPPTPGKTRLSKQQLASSISPAPFSNASKIFKTPSSIKKKLRERFSRTPKEGKSSKYNKRKLGKENEW
ncbi:golgin subfamily B member 1-like [Limulus polyphemus]|uniref:Golgin subfamily B member 1-like n=1 Tax=Limulus polyphemus TaxID=6850 RepID=A0ABM1SU95_LIMPO|nr:golgin subfamily B member 1-like [Limulus polyphemus]